MHPPDARRLDDWRSWSGKACHGLTRQPKIYVMSTSPLLLLLQQLLPFFLRLVREHRLRRPTSCVRRVRRRSSGSAREAIWARHGLLMRRRGKVARTWSRMRRGRGRSVEVDWGAQVWLPLGALRFGVETEVHAADEDLERCRCGWGDVCEGRIEVSGDQGRGVSSPTHSLSSQMEVGWQG